MNQATCTFSGGGGGSGATVVASMGVLDYTVPTGGTGYYNPVPTVTFSGGGATTQATGVTVLARPVATISVSGGQYYSSAPSVVINSSTQLQAQTSDYCPAPCPQLNLRAVGDVNHVRGGTVLGYQGAVFTSNQVGWATPPSVTITDDCETPATGSGATASCTINADHMMTCSITAAGSGYYCNPRIDYSGGTGAGSGATATAALSTTNGSITGLTLTSPGSGYTSAPTISFSNGAGAVAVATLATSRTYRLFYDAYTINPDAAFGIGCTDGNGYATACPGDSPGGLMTRFQLPDGRQYQFTYGQWNNLTQVITPDGAAMTYHYGAATGTIGDLSDATCPPGAAFAFLPNRVDSNTIYPQGLSYPGYTTNIDHIPSPNRIYRTTNPDGSVVEEIKFTESRVPSPYWLLPAAQTDEGRTAQTEHCSGPCNGTNLIDGVYYLDPNGTSYLTWDTASYNGTITPIHSWSMLDIRPTKVRHKKCEAGTCITWWETFTYDAASGIVTDNVFGARNRTLGNILNHATYADCSGAPCSTPLVQSVASYAASPAGANLDRMVTSSQVQDASGTTLARTDYTYDEYATYPLQASGASPGRLVNTYIVNNARSNATTVSHYIDATNYLSTHNQSSITERCTKRLMPKERPSVR